MLSVVVPAYNEEVTVGETIDRIQRALQGSGIPYEVIVVDDGSQDETAKVARLHGANVVSHPQNAGYGNALKTGIRNARFDWICTTDADGTYPVEDIPRLFSEVPKFDMVVGARTGRHFLGPLSKRLAREMFRWLSEFTAGRSIPDINSGLRIFRRDLAMEYFGRISSGFSFTTTLTLATLLEGGFVKYVPIDYEPRRARKSHVRYFRDTLRSAQIIVEAILSYNPLKLYLLVSLAGFLLVILVAGIALSVTHNLSVFFVGIIVAIHTSFLVSAAGLLCQAIVSTRGDESKTFKGRKGLEKEKQLVEGKFD